MKNTQTLTLSKKKYTYDILDSIDVGIEVVDNPYSIPIEQLFTMAARINKKRAFLFVSKVLGKHLPIDPNKGLLTAALLAARYVESVKGVETVGRESLLSAFLEGGTFQRNSFIPAHINPVVIGFAETATALGHAFFDCFQRAAFFHTTREEIAGHDAMITFEEEHSHATSHRCYIPLEMIHHQQEIILVDDELTTGKTALNIIQSIHRQYPRSEYTVVSILDWRSEEHQQLFLKLEQKLGITIHVVSLLSGQIRVTEKVGLEVRPDSGTVDVDGGESSIELIELDSFFQDSLYLSNKRLNKAPFIQETGRFGLWGHENSSVHNSISAAAAFLKQKRTGSKTLCLGTGEFMYLPMRLAAELGCEVQYQSTTRSPIYIESKESYGARFGWSFPNPEDPEVTHFVYNIPPGEYDECFVFFEREVGMAQLRPMLNELEKTGIHSIKIVFFSKIRGE